VDFIPDNLVEVAVKYQPEDPVILEEESYYDESSIKGTIGPSKNRGRGHNSLNFNKS
jgi:hypothetical protein